MIFTIFFQNSIMFNSIAEGSTFYKIASWRGTGNQRQRFYDVFTTLHEELYGRRAALWDTRRGGVAHGLHDLERYPAEIVSKREVTLINPFTDRLRAFYDANDAAAMGSLTSAATGDEQLHHPYNGRSGHGNHANRDQRHRQQQRQQQRTLMLRGGSTAVCMEDLNVVDMDVFRRHFRFRKEPSKGSPRARHQFIVPTLDGKPVEIIVLDEGDVIDLNVNANRSKENKTSMLLNHLDDGNNNGSINGNGGGSNTAGARVVPAQQSLI